MADHKVEAERLLGMATRKSFSDGDRDGWRMSAMVHATLYAAEQQRIANLIRLVESESNLIGEKLTAGVLMDAQDQIRRGIQARLTDV